MTEEYSVSITRSHFRMLAPQLINETAVQRYNEQSCTREYNAILDRSE